MPISWKNTEKTYGKTSIYLSWLSYILILCIFPLAITDLTDMTKSLFSLYNLLCIFSLLIVVSWIFWWAYDKSVLRLETTPLWEAKLLRLIRLFSKLLCLAIPVTGLYMISALYGQTDILGLIVIPPIHEISPDFGRAMKGLHLLSFWILFGLCLVNICFALYHHWIIKDATLRRILPISRQSLSIKNIIPKKPANKVIRFPKKIKK